MNISKREITVALAHRTREMIMAKKAIYAAQHPYHHDLMLLACFAVPLHAIYA